ncbi:hypothetical protein BD410DRAFT_72283 [Rickenella mellea]|uniref:Uncharacterized protein n=1 Tax=Rickenella mellea TaxID=50990 RepID=A0A4Y7QCQ0_9AGAM|nr:hypothetical protein BD410DRAFT_72283 [Rickenella mellea]
MANRRSPPSNPYPTHSLRLSSRSRHKYQLRNSPLGKKRGLVKADPDSHASSSTSPSRPVLVPLHPNLRRLPSRVMTYSRNMLRNFSGASQNFNVPVGAKRKRIASGNENTYVSGRGTRDRPRFKRQRSMNSREDTSDDENMSTSAMDIDEESNLQWEGAEESDAEETELDDCMSLSLVGDSLDNTVVNLADDFLINEAGPRQLQRLKKDELMRVYSLAGLSDPPDDLTKTALITAIMSAREDGGDVPPSSPPGRTDGHSSGYSSDDGNDGGGEETDIPRTSPHHLLRRRITVQDLGRTVSRPMKGRSLSLNNALSQSVTGGKMMTRFPHLDGNGTARRRATNGISSQSSPTDSSSSTVIPSPPITRLRSRTLSTENKTSTSLSSSSASGTSSKGSSASNGQVRRKGKAKRVDFSDAIHEFTAEQDIHDALTAHESYSNPSPRRLRSKGKETTIAPSCPISEALSNRRVTPMRKAKDRAVCVKEDESEEEAVADEEDQRGF